jgi:hypothetical protein
MPLTIVTRDEKRGTYKPQLTRYTSIQLVSSSPLGETNPSIKPAITSTDDPAEHDHECVFIDAFDSRAAAKRGVSSKQE